MGSGLHSSTLPPGFCDISTNKHGLLHVCRGRQVLLHTLLLCGVRPANCTGLGARSRGCTTAWLGSRISSSQRLMLYMCQPCQLLHSPLLLVLLRQRWRRRLLPPNAN
jgi:hypothetical protein